MSLLRAILDTFLQWTATAEAECRAFRKVPDDVKHRLYAEADEADCISIYSALEAEFPAEGIQPFLDSLRCPENHFTVAFPSASGRFPHSISIPGRLLFLHSTSLPRLALGSRVSGRRRQ